MIRAATRSELEYIASLLPYPVSPNAKGVMNDGAMVIYDGWTPNSVQVHVYSTGAKFLFDPRFLREIFWYPFIQCGKGLIYTVTPSDSRASLAVSKKLGFTEVYRQKDGWSVGVDMVVKEMRKENCRWIRSLH